jgi:AraC family transcriptional regulator, regulatory protein of adaptative response / methylated-DNA-[protein]-cysteine methyltransferase
MNVQPVPLSQASLDYERIAKAISYLEANYLEQPGLETVARAVHMSEFHFQRVFSRWAGISPKRFLQFLTVEHAKRQLAESRPVLDATFDSGLSSPGRLHDLFVSVEAVTPGEFKTRGEGIQIAFGFHPTPFGQCLVGVTSRGVCWLSFHDNGSHRAAVRDLQSRWSGAQLDEQPTATGLVVNQIFSNLYTTSKVPAKFPSPRPSPPRTGRGRRAQLDLSSGIEKGEKSPLSLLLMGTNFQLKVWQALLRIPRGEVTTYENVGELIGARNSARAIGSAVGDNRIAYLIPCHRVIRKSGLLGGYHWGEPRKRAMLAWEAARSAA